MRWKNRRQLVLSDWCYQSILDLYLDLGATPMVCECKRGMNLVAAKATNQLSIQNRDHESI